jgi:hypothetical protein
MSVRYWSYAVKILFMAYARFCALERFGAKACPALDAGWSPWAAIVPVIVALAVWLQ